MASSSTIPAAVAHGPAAGAVFDQTQHTSEDGRTSHRLVVGIACGTALLLALIAVTCWVTRAKLAGYYCAARTRVSIFSSRSDKSKSTDSSPVSSSGAKVWSIPARSTHPAPVEAAVDRTRSAPQDWARQQLRNDSSTTAAKALHGICHSNLGSRRVRESERAEDTCLDPEPLSTTTAGVQIRARPEPPWMQNPSTPAATIDLLNRSLPASPSLSSIPMPVTPSSPPPTTTSTPYAPLQRDQNAHTPSYLYAPYPPTSLPRPQATNHGPSHSTLATPAPCHTKTQVVPNHPPPSLPQPYSTVSLGSTAEIYRRLDSSVDLYRGLSTRGGGRGKGRERPPWDYLSAEEARRGGWRNRDGGRESGQDWETLAEDVEGDEDGWSRRG